MKKPKFTLVDYVIIIAVIVAIVFAFIHIASDDSNDEESSSYDSSTMNKVVEKYLGYYKEGQIVKTSIEGLNASNNEPVELSGEVKWMDDDGGSNVKVLVETNDGNQYLAGLYEDVPNADIYLDEMSLEVNGEKYNNLTEFKIAGENITSISDLTKGLNNTSSYEISTAISAEEIDGNSFQSLTNQLYDDGKISVKLSNVGLNERLTFIRAGGDEITLANNMLGEINGVSSDITIRVYNCTASQQQEIEDNYNVTNIKTF